MQECTTKISGDNKEYSHTLQLRIILELLNKKVKFKRTKLQPLMQISMLKSSKEFQKYLLSLDESLQVNNWNKLEINKQKEFDKNEKKTKNRKRTGNSKNLVDRLKEKITLLLTPPPIIAPYDIPAPSGPSPSLYSQNKLNTTDNNNNIVSSSSSSSYHSVGNAFNSPPPPPPPPPIIAPFDISHPSPSLYSPNKLNTTDNNNNIVLSSSSYFG